MEIDGELDDDIFVVRSFIMVENGVGSMEDPKLGNTTIRGGEGADVFYVSSHDDPMADMPVYIANNFVDIDGGTGWNNLTLFGTEQNDRFIVEDGLVFSGGLSVHYINVAYLAVAGESGDDEIIILSTTPSIMLSVYGGLGSDNIIVSPTTVLPVESKNYRGHRGIIEHTGAFVLLLPLHLIHIFIHCIN